MQSQLPRQQMLQNYVTNQINKGGRGGAGWTCGSVGEEGKKRVVLLPDATRLSRILYCFHFPGIGATNQAEEYGRRYIMWQDVETPAGFIY